MKDSRFDSITISMASNKSRRGLLKGLFGTVAGGAVTAVSIVDADAAGRAARETCRKDSDCTNGFCGIAADGRRRCCNLECYNCGYYETETCCDNRCPN